MAPAAPELLLLGLMHFALARLDIWHWKVLKMLLQNSGILTAAAFLPSTTTDFRRLRPAFQSPPCSQVAFCPAHLRRFTSGCTKRADTPPWGTCLSRGGYIQRTRPCLGAGGLAHKGRIPAFSGYSGGCWAARHHGECTNTKLHL